MKSEGLDSPDMLGVDDFTDIFDNIADFEKEIGIDGEVNSSNIQSIGVEQEHADTLNHHHDGKSLDSTLYETGSRPSTTPSPTQLNLVSSTTSGTCGQLSYGQKWKIASPTTSPTASDTHFLSSDESRNMASGHSVGDMKNKLSAGISKVENAHLGISWNRTPESAIQRYIEQAQQKQRRHQKWQDSIHKRRQQFQRQKTMDDEHVSHRLARIFEQARADTTRHRVMKRHQDISSDAALGRALLDVFSAATASGLPQLDSGDGTTLPPPHHHHHHQDSQHGIQEHTTGEAAGTENLDPEDPDPWDEERQHYLLMGQIKRLESLRAMCEMETAGKQYEPTLYNPTGIQRHEFDPLLSRHGAGLSVIGAALDAVSTNSRIRPTGNHGSSLVLQDQQDARTYAAQYLDLQSISKRQRISMTLGTTWNSKNDSLDTYANNGGGKSNQMDTLAASSLSVTHDKTAKLMVSNLGVDVTESRLETLTPKGLKSLYVNRSNHTAILYLLSIDSAVMFRRMYNRSLVGGQHIAVDFIKN